MEIWRLGFVYVIEIMAASPLLWHLHWAVELRAAGMWKSMELWTLAFIVA